MSLVLGTNQYCHVGAAGAGGRLSPRPGHFDKLPAQPIKEVKDVPAPLGRESPTRETYHRVFGNGGHCILEALVYLSMVELS